MKNILCSIVVLIVSLTSKAQFYTYDAANTIKSFIALDDFNRIEFIHDRIEQVFGRHQLYELELDEKNGQVFIKPHQLTPMIALTITTESGRTQDLLLMPKVIQAQTIRIEATEKSKKLSSSITLKEALKQRMPLEGYQVDESPQYLKAPRLWRFKRIYKLTNNIFDGEVIKIVNLSPKNQSFHPYTKELDGAYDWDMALHDFKPYEQRILIIVTKVEGARHGG